MRKFFIICLIFYSIAFNLEARGANELYTNRFKDDDNVDFLRPIVLNYYTKRNLAALMKQKNQPNKDQTQSVFSPIEFLKRSIQSIKSKGNAPAVGTNGKRLFNDDVSDPVSSSYDYVFDDQMTDDNDFVPIKRFLGRLPHMGPAPKSKTTTTTENI